MPKICPRYAQDMPKIWLPVRRSWQNIFLTKRLSWSWQNVFLTKRLRQVCPDKTSKAVLTKRLTDQMSILTKRLLTKVLSNHQSWLSTEGFVSAWYGLEGESTRKNKQILRFPAFYCSWRQLTNIIILLQFFSNLSSSWHTILVAFLS